MRILWWIILTEVLTICYTFHLNSCLQILEKVNSTKCFCDEKETFYNLTCPSHDDHFFDILLVEDNYEIDCKNSVIHNTSFVPDIGIERLDAVAYFGFIDCSMLQFVDLTTKIIHTKNVKRLALKKINYMIPAVLEGFQISILHIYDSPVDSLPEDLLYPIDGLESISINNNNISQIPEFFFAKSKTLQRIDLGKNNLAHIPTSLFTGLDDLKILLLFGNKLQTIDHNIFKGLNKLETVELMTNEMNEIPDDAFIYLPQLTDLSLRNNLFKTFPVGLFRNNKHLKSLQLSNNQFLLSLPERFFENLTELEEIHIRNCNLTILPENVFWGTKNLKRLYIDVNYLSHLKKDTFRDTVNLEELNLANNVLETLEGGIFTSLINLKELNLNYNKIKIFENTFSGLKNLEKFYLVNNALSYFSKNSFKHFKNLTILDMSYNNLTLDLKNFKEERYSALPILERLEKLYLQHNEIPYIYSDWVVTYKNLKELNLENNKITSLDNSDLQFIQDHTITVNLRNNHITTIDMSGTEAMYYANKDTIPNGKRNIYLNGNPIKCDCRIYDLVRYIDGTMLKDVLDNMYLEIDKINCETSTKYEGIPLIQLKSRSLTCVLDDGPVLPTKCKDGTQHYQFRQFDKRLIMNCSNKGLTEMPKIDFLYNSAYKSFDIEVILHGNNITQLSKPVGYYDNVVELDLSYNKINQVDWIPPKIEVLKLDNNNLSYFNNEDLLFISKNNTRLSLTFHNNPWHCDCNLINFTKYLQENFQKVSNLSEIQCFEDARKLTSLSPEDLCPQLLQLITVICIVLAVLGLFMALAVGLYCRYQQQIKVWMYAHNLCLYFITEEELDQDKLYDAFISFSHEDEDFVVGKLLPGLEEGPQPFKLCVHFRDWQPGEFITTNIARSIDESRRTVVVLSRGFLRSEWGRMEFRTAHTEALKEGRARVIVILYGDIGPVEDLDSELRAYLSTNTYIKWDTPWFWDNLRYALPHSSKHVKSTVASRKQLEKDPHYIDKMDLIKEPSTPPASTTPPADAASKLYNPLLHSALNVALIDGTLINKAPEKHQLNNNHISLV